MFIGRMRVQALPADYEEIRASSLGHRSLPDKNGFGGTSLGRLLLGQNVWQKGYGFDITAMPPYVRNRDAGHPMTDTLSTGTWYLPSNHEDCRGRMGGETHAVPTRGLPGDEHRIQAFVASHSLKAASISSCVDGNPPSLMASALRLASQVLF